MADTKKLQSKINIQKFDGENEYFDAREMLFGSIIELEGLIYV